ncbi:crossover junction endodeoxyribonuclease RuvA [Peptidiphaga gingivicola]|uniref:Putative pre-16S rRNA nuclease n=1 Tax=Peptidiphaga gingivicola TaxID=2741497 RepID=A0A179B626_9ACTO|nr:Holliday junction resolvase RuvX [Peptidiphaga gingivicola]OAP86870.1 crossover junction endodeoxyribonuclease RuvA [Peptidiphaga gingivicola]
MRRGRRVGFDVGQVRIGVAQCDPEGILATPVETLWRGESDIDDAAQIVRDCEAMEVIVGLPLNMDGTEGASARDARAWAAKLAESVAPAPVRLVDERLSTVTAHGQLIAAGRNSRKHRSIVDQAAAVVILNTALEMEQRTGNAPGECVSIAQEAQQ